MRKADKSNKDKIANPQFKPLYHLSAPYGWINDPNGFCRYQDEWHLFYQYNPYAARWGRMHWGHAKSKDLCKWEALPVALSPDGKSKDGFLGCFSGSAIEKDGELYLMYTGVPFFKQHQLLAKSADGIVFNKMIKPVIPIKNRPPQAGKFAFRDPKIIVHNGVYYCVIGASKGKGRQIALYKSNNLTEWEYSGSIKSEKISKGIFECPDIAHTEEADILIYSVMHTETKGLDYQNLHSCVYELGHTDYKKASFTSLTSVKEFDCGADFYAPQTTPAPDQRVIMVAWMQMWMRSIPTAYLGHGFAGMMTLPRELEVRDNILYQRPAREVYRLFEGGISANCFIKEEIEIENYYGSVFLLKIKMKYKDNLTVTLRKGENCNTIILFDKGKVTFNRENSGYKIKGRAGDGNCNIREMYIEPSEWIEAEIFSDKSSIELFVNEKYCMSNTVYPFDDSEGISFISENGALISAVFCPFIKNC